MKKTAIFYHPSFSRRSYLTVGNRLADFPDALVDLLEYPNIFLLESKPVSEELLKKVHTEDMIKRVRAHSFCATADISAGGVVEATELILKGEYTNAFCFIGCGGHHAGRNYFWGACCFNDVILSIVNAREKYGEDLRFVILDTDAHHGDGTRELLTLFNDRKTLHLCLCDREWVSEDKAKYDFDVTWVYYNGNPDERYLEVVDRALEIAADFKPHFFFWYFGFDTYKGDYGSLGLSKEVFLDIAKRVKKFASLHCEDKLQVVLAGGSLREVATWVIPRIIKILALWEEED